MTTFSSLIQTAHNYLGAKDTSGGIEEETAIAAVRYCRGSSALLHALVTNVRLRYNDVVFCNIMLQLEGFCCCETWHCWNSMLQVNLGRALQQPAHSHICSLHRSTQSQVAYMGQQHAVLYPDYQRDASHFPCCQLASGHYHAAACSPCKNVVLTASYLAVNLVRWVQQSSVTDGNEEDRDIGDSSLTVDAASMVMLQLGAALDMAGAFDTDEVGSDVSHQASFYLASPHFARSSWCRLHLAGGPASLCQVG